MEALSHHRAKRLTRLSGLVPLGTFAAMCGSWVLLLPTIPLMSAARVIKCLATVPDGWPGHHCVKASRMARYLRRLSLIACSFWMGCALQREYTMSQPLKCFFQNDLQKCPVENWCYSCKRTFNDLTNTLLHQSKRPLAYWILATFLLCLACSSRHIAREVGVHIRTSYRWCWWLRNAALSYEMHRQLEGTVEADDLYHTAGNKGQAAQGGKKSLGRRARGRRKKREPGRGHYDKDRPAIIAWVSRQGSVIIQATRDFTVKTVQKAADLAVQTGSRLYTDSASSYRALKGYVHDYVNHTKKEYARG